MLESLTGSRTWESRTTRMDSERRRLARKTPPQLVYLGIGENNGGMVRDISHEGIGFRAVNPLLAEGAVRFMFVLEGQTSLEGTGEVVWQDQNHKAGGLRFKEVSEEFRRELGKWMRKIDASAQTAPAEPSARKAQLRGQLAPTSGSFREARRETSKASAMMTAIGRAPTEKTETPKEQRNPPARTTANVLSYGGSGNLPAFAPQPVEPVFGGPFFQVPPRRQDRSLGWTIAVVVLVTAAASLFLFHQSVGGGLIWLGENMKRPPTVAQTPVARAEKQTADAQSSQKADTPLEQKTEPQTGTENKPALNQVDPTKTPAKPAPAAVNPVSNVAQSNPVDAVQTPQPLPVTEDKAEQVRLLWEAVAKGRVSAEIALADLYAKGDGVPQSCAQARVLLSAAVKKGSELAKQKLSELESLGCS